MITQIRRARARVSSGEDAGMALVLVIGSMIILTMLASAGLAYAVGSMPQARHDQDYNAALAAAEAGVDDYVRHVNNDDSYWQTPHCENLALNGPNDPNCLAATAGYQPINASDPTGKGPAFHYDVDTSTLATANNAITVTSTGRVHNVKRTLQVSVSRSGSTQFVYYTDYEDADPTNEVVYPSGPPTNPYCTKHYWEGRSTHETVGGSSCVEINFVTGDVLNGKVHSNDTPLVNGSPKFGDSYEVSDPACGPAANDYWGCWHGSSTSDKSETPAFQKPPPQYEASLILPDNSADLSRDPGCQYVGQTRIRFTGDGNMLVWSPESTVSAACGGTHPFGVSVPVPDNQVIYAAAAASTHECAAGEIGDGLPIAGDITMTRDDQLCGQGNIYVEGSVLGRVTLAAENSIILTGDLTLKGSLNGTDMTGLVAGNSVEVMHPWIDTVATTCPAGTQSSDTTYVRTPGKWVSAGGGGSNPKAGKVWQGEDWSPGYSAGGWVTQPTTGGGSPKPELWQAGSWDQDGSGNWSWTNGKWVTMSGNYGNDSVDGWQLGAAGQYWQGETWTKAKDCFGESTTWPHRNAPNPPRTSSTDDIFIYASIQTLQHSFLVQNYDQGTQQGKLTVWGSIAQRYRGIVGTGSAGSGTGYLKNYNYDSRLVYSSPPYFPQWVNANWRAGRTGEISPIN